MSVVAPFVHGVSGVGEQDHVNDEDTAQSSAHRDSQTQRCSHNGENDSGSSSYSSEDRSKDILFENCLCSYMRNLLSHIAADGVP